MQFALNEEQVLIDDTVERLLSSESGPDVWPKLAELGLLGAALPEAYGGSDGGPKELLILARRLGRHLVASPFLATIVVAAHILRTGATGGSVRAEQLLPLMIGGEHTVANAVFEQSTRYRLDGLQTRARTTDGGIVLSGSKHYVLDGGAADSFVVAAITDGGLGLYSVDANAEGLRCVAYQSVDGSELATVHFDDVLIPSANTLIAPPQGLTTLEQALAMGAFGVSADILGACEAALEQTVEYLKVREQFGMRLSRFQALQHRASDLHAEIEMLRSLVLGAAQSLEAGVNDLAMADALAAAVLAAEVGDHVGREAIQMHGAVGMTRDLGVGRYLMRANTLTRLFGDTDRCRNQYLTLLDAALAGSSATAE